MPNNERWFMNSYVKILQSQGNGSSGVSVIEHALPKNFQVPPHFHRDEEESFYMLEGVVRFDIGSEQVSAGPGQFVQVAKGAVHSLSVMSPTARFLTITDGAFEKMVMEFSTPAEAPGIPPQQPFEDVDQKRLVAFCQQNGIEFLPPPNS